MTKTCLLHLQDEVNVRFHGLDASTRRKLKRRVEFFLPHAKYSAAYKLGRWDGKVSMCDTGGRTYFHLLDLLLPIVIEHGYHVEIQDDRVQLDYHPEPITDQYLSHKTWPAGHVHEHEPIVLRDYQVEIVNKFLENPQSVAEVSTGAGKTILIATMSYLMEKAGRTIVIVPNRDLVDQTLRDYVNLGLDVGVFYGGKLEYDRTHTLCTWQSIESLLRDNKKSQRVDELRILLDNQVCVIVDEVHASKAQVLRDQLSGLFRNVPYRWGLTGTIPKEEHLALSVQSTLGPIVHQLHSRELQDKGVLANLEIQVLQFQDGIVDFGNYASELKWLTTDPTRIQQVAQHIRQISNDGNTLVLIDRIATGDMLKELNPDWAFVSGATRSQDRQDEYSEISDNDNRVIVATYGVASVGIDIPRIFNLVMLEPGKSFVRVIQSIGRGIRKANDKDHVNVYDITSNLKFSKRHLTKRKAFYREKQFPFTITKVKYN